MTPYAKGLLEENGIRRKMDGKDIVKIVLLTVIAGALFVAVFMGVNNRKNVWK